jgi:hypothetical protein
VGRASELGGLKTVGADGMEGWFGGDWAMEEAEVLEGESDMLWVVQLPDLDGVGVELSAPGSGSFLVDASRMMGLLA